jgi:hypothetical protein
MVLTFGLVFFFSFSVSSCFFQFLPFFPLFSSRLFFKFTTRSLALIALALFLYHFVTKEKEQSKGNTSPVFTS